MNVALPTECTDAGIADRLMHFLRGMCRRHLRLHALANRNGSVTGPSGTALRSSFVRIPNQPPQRVAFDRLEALLAKSDTDSKRPSAAAEIGK